MGGDEFVALLPDLGEARNAEVISAKLVAARSVPISVADCALQVSVRIGVYVASVVEHDPEALLKRLGAAMHKAKENGGNCYAVAKSTIAEGLQVRNATHA